MRGAPEGVLYGEIGGNRFVIGQRKTITAPASGTLTLATTDDVDRRYGRGHTDNLAAGDIVLLATDGIAETFSPNREMFEKGRLFDVLRQNRNRSASEIVQSLHTAVVEFAQGTKQEDDVTAVVIKVE